MKASMEAIEKAAQVLREGRTVIYPTDTLYAMGAPIYDKEAVLQVFSAKRRPLSQVISVAVSSLEMASKIAEIPSQVHELLCRYLPGPFTFILPPKMHIEGITSRGVGVRVPDSAVALRLIDLSGPLTATSANIHGTPPPSLPPPEGHLGADLVLDSGPCRYAVPSAIVDLTGDRPRILRRGPFTIEMDVD